MIHICVREVKEEEVEPEMADAEVALNEHKQLFLQKLEKGFGDQKTDADVEGRSQFLTEQRHDKVKYVIEQWPYLDPACRKALSKELGCEQAYA